VHPYGLPRSATDDPAFAGDIEAMARTICGLASAPAAVAELSDQALMLNFHPAPEIAEAPYRAAGGGIRPGRVSVWRNKPTAGASAPGFLQNKANRRRTRCRMSFLQNKATAGKK